jgi:hypothetical protein
MTLPDALPIVLPVVLPGITGLLLIGLILLVSTAMIRSAKRLECARLRDELVDAARLGELDVSDARVFWLIDWFDRVAATGRLITSGRHATERPDTTSLTASLTHALTADGRRAEVGPSWPAGASWPSGPSWQSDLFGVSGGRDIQTRAVRYQKRKLRQRQDPPKHGGLDVTGHPKPLGALMPVSGPIPLSPPLPPISLSPLEPMTLPRRPVPPVSAPTAPVLTSPVPALLPIRPVPGRQGVSRPGTGWQGPRRAPAMAPLEQSGTLLPSALSGAFVPSSNRSVPSRASNTAAPDGPQTPTPRATRASRNVVAPRSAPAPRHAGRTVRDAERDAGRATRDAERDAEREAGRAGHNALKDQIFAVAAQNPR